jgi:hypothetical protein
MLDIIVGDTGTLFNFTIYETDGHNIVDITNATKATLYIKYPDGITIKSVPCTIGTPGSNGIVNYINQDGDFPFSGTYILEMQVQFTDQVFNSRSISLRVGDSIIPSTPI